MPDLVFNFVVGAFIVGAIFGAGIVTYIRSSADKKEYYDGLEKRRKDEHEDNAI